MVLNRIISPAAERCGYDQIIRADQIPRPGWITSQIIEHIVDDDLVIADLTDQNPNVFYELALRHGTRKPVVLLICRGQRIPFDVSQNRVIEYDLQDWDSPDRCKDQLIEQINSLQHSPSDFNNPVSPAIHLQPLS